MAAPPLSIVEFSMPHLTFAEDIDVCRGAGMEGIGLCEVKILDLEADLERFQESGLTASSMFAEVTTILPARLLSGPDDPLERIAAMKQSLRRLAPFRPLCCFVSAGPLGAFEPERARELALTGMRELAAVAADEGIVLAAEVMPPSLGDEFSFITSISEMVDFVDEVDHPNARIAVDVWHMSEVPESFDTIRDAASRVVSVHVNDRRDPTRSWADRVLPGDGIIDLAGMFDALEAGGYDGWYEFEVISDDGHYDDDFPDSLWRLDPTELFTRGRKQFLDIWSARA
jgi:sugar phosphate isomerase/epimerase